jgi:hypothetical protein
MRVGRFLGTDAARKLDPLHRRAAELYASGKRQRLSSLNFPSFVHSTGARRWGHLVMHQIDGKSKYYVVTGTRTSVCGAVTIATRASSEQI